MISPIAKKLGMKPGMRALIIAPPPGYLKLLEPLPDGLIVSSVANGMYAFVQVFATRLSEISKFVPETLETRDSEHVDVGLLPEENIEDQQRAQSRPNPQGDECHGMAHRVHRCHRRSLVSIALSGRQAK